MESSKISSLHPFHRRGNGSSEKVTLFINSKTRSKANLFGALPWGLSGSSQHWTAPLIPRPACFWNNTKGTVFDLQISHERGSLCFKAASQDPFPPPRQPLRHASDHSQGQEGARLHAPQAMTVAISTHTPRKRHAPQNQSEATEDSSNSELIKA